MSKNDTSCQQADDSRHFGYFSKTVRKVAEAENKKDFFDCWMSQKSATPEKVRGHKTANDTDANRSQA